MKLIQNDKGEFEVEFNTQVNTTGSVPLGTSIPERARELSEAIRVRELEAVSQITNLTHQVVTQIIAGRDFTIGAAINLWEKSSRDRMVLSPNSIETGRSLCTQWASVCGLTDKPVASATPENIASYINRGKVRRTTSLRILAAIRSLFAFLVNEGYVLRNPAAKGMVRVNYASFTHAEKEPCNKFTFTDNEIAALLVGADPFWRCAIILAVGTGLRISDIAQLEWASVGSGRVIVWTDKTNTRVDLPLTGDIEAALGALPATGIQYVFPEQREVILDTKRRSLLSIQFSRLCKKVGINDKTFHCLRHTYAHRRQGEGLTVEAIGAELGHRGTDTTKLYLSSDRGIATPCAS